MAEFEAAKAALDALWAEYVEEAKVQEVGTEGIDVEARVQDFFTYRKVVNEETDPAEWTDEFQIAPNLVGDHVEIRLSICMQMDLGVYVEPTLDQPETYEDEQRLYVLDKVELREWLVKAEEQAEKYRRSVEECIVFARRGVSYATMHLIVTGEPANSVYSDNVYEADEDLMFLYERLHALHRFIFEVKTGEYLDAGSE